MIQVIPPGNHNGNLLFFSITLVTKFPMHATLLLKICYDINLIEKSINSVHDEISLETENKVLIERENEGKQHFFAFPCFSLSQNSLLTLEN